MTRWTSKRFEDEGYGRQYAWVDFANSLYPDGFGNVQDCLDQENWRALFLVTWCLPRPGRKAFPVDAFRAFRATLRAAAVGVVENGVPPARTLATINRSLREIATRSIESTLSGYQLVLNPSRCTWGWVRAQIAASFGEFLASGRHERLKLCANPLCRWLFYDESKSGAKRWCDEHRCGNRDKVRRYRAKRDAPD